VNPREATARELEIVIAGFGGQGVLFAGLVLAHAALLAGREVAWIPFYGPEMRGGTAGCTVIISDEEIGSPIVARPGAAIVLNQPSLAKWGPRVRSDGMLVINSALAVPEVGRGDLRVVSLPANEIAAEIGNGRTANVVALGALLAATDALPLEVVESALAETLGRDKQHLLGVNVLALRRGLEAAERVLPPVTRASVTNNRRAPRRSTPLVRWTTRRAE
jgi:2-oxoglutarate ferredoxin oxidoreductase subunit gamma